MGCGTMLAVVGLAVPVPWRSLSLKEHATHTRMGAGRKTCLRLRVRVRGCNGLSGMLSYAVQASHSKHATVYTATDLSSGLVDVCGWSVIFEGKGYVGKVAEIVQVKRVGSTFDCDNEDSTYEFMLKVTQTSNSVEDGTLGLAAMRRMLENVRNGNRDKQLIGTEFLIPIVDAFIREVDARKKRLVILPPQGLFELAKRPEAVRKLHPVILEFCQQHAGILKERFTGIHKRNNKFKYSHMSDVEIEDIVCSYMPTRDQLQAAGRWDLIRQIKAAGGFLFVAHALNLKSKRRPDGFWEDIRELDAEIDRFIVGSWIEKVHGETGAIYYENQVTKDVSLHKPSSTPCELYSVGQKGVKAMPQQKLIWQAGRWDLHHAIVFNGGYREVASELGRQTVRSSTQLLQQQMDAISRIVHNQSHVDRENSPDCSK